MNVNGYKLREAIREWTVKKELAEQAFEKSLYVFPGETGIDPNDLWVSYRTAELAIVKLQAIQNEYNLRVKINSDNGTLSLAEAVKKVGALSRFVAMWKKALSKQAVEKSRWADDRTYLVRNKDDIVAQKKVSDEVCQANIVALKKSENGLRASIATANATFIDLTLGADLL